MLTRRVIACLDVRDGVVVKGVRFAGHRRVGDVLSLAQRYRDDGADELVLYDIKASTVGERVAATWVEAAAAALDIPFCVAGGVGTVADARALLAAGADKVSVNSRALARPGLIDELAAAVGSQSVVVGIDSRAIAGDYRVFQYAGSEQTVRDSGRRLLDWVREVQDRGAGEIVLNCMDADGVRGGFDLRQLAAVRPWVRVPLIASGGAGAPEHFLEVFRETDVDGALAASIFHEGTVTIPAVKARLAAAGVAVRR